METIGKKLFLKIWFIDQSLDLTKTKLLSLPTLWHRRKELPAIFLINCLKNFLVNHLCSNWDCCILITMLILKRIIKYFSNKILLSLLWFHEKFFLMTNHLDKTCIYLLMYICFNTGIAWVPKLNLTYVSFNVK